MANLLIIDDNKAALIALEMLFQDIFEKVISLTQPGTVISVFLEERIDVVILDMNFSIRVKSGSEGLFWLKTIKKLKPEVPVILITAFGEIELAVESMKEGAFDFILKPWKNEKIKVIVNRALDSSNKVALSKDANGKEKLHEIPFIGSSPNMLELKKTIQKVALTNANVLIVGEKGVGKKHVAREIYKLSNNCDTTFKSLDLKAFDEKCFENELREHLKLNEVEKRNSMFLFLDGIETLNLSLQSRLLIFLKNIINQKINLRLISATNSDVFEMVKNAEFWEDLSDLMNTIHINVPPLRQRKDDIYLLADYFLGYYQNYYNKTGLRFSDEAVKRLQEHSWPGNIKELQRTIERAVILTDHQVLLKNDFQLLKMNSVTHFEPSSFEEMEKKLIISAISRLDQNLSAVAQELGISRQTLYNKMKKYDL